MRSILTSWKEIAQYVGKGVRTVQRWEKEFGMPIRRATSDSRHAVLAIPDEIDAWARGQSGGSRSELETLRAELAALREENMMLRAELNNTYRPLREAEGAKVLTAA